MDEHTFLVNRERAVDYLNSLDKVSCFLSTCFICYSMKKKKMETVDLSGFEICY